MRPALLLQLALVLATPALQNVGAQAIPFERAVVERVGPGNYRVSWTAPRADAIEVFAGTDPDDIGRGRVMGRGPSSGEVVLSGLPKASRWYFDLVPTRGRSLVLADRDLGITSVANFRDVGGYRTSDGRWVRMGVLYRSGEISQLSDGDLATLTGNHIRLVCDLRTDDERSRSPDRLPAGTSSLVANVLAGNEVYDHLRATYTDSAEANKLLAGGGARQLMIDLYRSFVSNPGARRAYHDVFARLADPASLPSIFHCTGGKDRSGWAAAVFLTMLGVPRHTVIEDFLLSNDYLRERNAGRRARLVAGVDPKLFEPIITLDQSYVEAAFDEVKARYGSFDRYLRDGLELDESTIAGLKAAFLTR